MAVWQRTVRKQTLLSTQNNNKQQTCAGRSVAGHVASTWQHVRRLSPPGEPPRSADVAWRTSSSCASQRGSSDGLRAMNWLCQICQKQPGIRSAGSRWVKPDLSGSRAKALAGAPGKKNTWKRAEATPASADTQRLRVHVTDVTVIVHLWWYIVITCLSPAPPLSVTAVSHSARINAAWMYCC